MRGNSICKTCAAGPPTSKTALPVDGRAAGRIFHFFDGRHAGRRSGNRIGNVEQAHQRNTTRFGARQATRSAERHTKRRTVLPRAWRRISGDIRRLSRALCSRTLLQHRPAWLTFIQFPYRGRAISLQSIFAFQNFKRPRQAPPRQRCRQNQRGGCQQPLSFTILHSFHNRLSFRFIPRFLRHAAGSRGASSPL